MPPGQSDADRLFALSLDLLCLVGVDGYFRQVNAAFERTLGWMAAELLACPFIDLVHPDDRATTSEAVRSLALGVPLDGFESRFRCRDGTYRWLSWRATTPDERGLLYAVARDDTAQRHADAQLRFHATLLDAVGQAVVATDLAGTITYWNCAAEALYGWRAEEAVGRNVIEVTPAEQSREQAEAIMTCLRQGQSWSGEFVVRRRDGTPVLACVRDTPVLDAAGRLIGIVGVSTDVGELRRVGDALRASEERYRTLLAQASDAILVADPAGRVVVANEAAHRLLGYGRAELLERRLDDLVAPDELAVRPLRLDELRVGAALLTERRLRRKDGSIVPVEISSTRLPDGSFQGIVRDVTARHRAEETLRRQALTFTTIHDAVVTADIAGNVVDWNPAAERTFGYTKAEMLGRSAATFYPPDVADAQHAAIAAGLAKDGRWAGELRFRRKDGTEGVCETVVVVLPGPDGAPIGGVGVNRDVTDRKRAEDALRRQKEMLQVVFDHIPAMVVLFDAAGRPALLNREWTRVTGWPLEDAQRVDLIAEIYPDHDQQARARRFVWSAVGQWGDFRMRVRDGRVLDTVWANVLLSDGSVVGIGQDVTERRQLEAQFRQAQKMEAVGQLAGGIAHDFNNLIQVITGATLFAREQLPPDSPVLPDLAEIDAAAGRAAALTRQLLAFSRRQVLKPELLDVNRIVTSVERMLRRVIGADIDLVTDLQSGLAPVLADAGQLEQVLLNLAVNARDAMPDGGTLTVETREERLDADAAQRHPGLEPGPYVELRVRDTGCGMDEATQARVFEPFFTTKEPARGTGLGLATVYGIVTQSGGGVYVDSTPGAGSTFTILLPAIDGASVTGMEDAPSARAVRGTETILLVEHETNVRGAVRRMLERGGYAVLEAARAADALRILAEPERRVDLVLSDVVMPEMGAGPLIAQIRERHGGLRVLLMSGYGGEAVSRLASVGGDVELLAKPFAPDELLRRIRGLLDRSPAD